MNPILNLFSNVLGGMVSIFIGFVLNAYQEYSSKELMYPMYIILVIIYVFKVLREKWLVKKVELVYQYETIIGIRPIAGKTLFVSLYKAQKLVISFFVGFVFCWIFVFLANM